MKTNIKTVSYPLAAAEVKKPVGTVIINACKLPASSIEIVPAGNGKYAITLRQEIKSVPGMFREDYKGICHLVYINEHMDSMKFEGKFLDFGINDEDGKCILSLFFSMAEESSPIIRVGTI